MSEDGNDEGISLEFNAKQAAIISLFIGLVLGGFGGFTAGAVFSGSTVTPSVQDVSDTDSSGDNSVSNDEQSPEEVFTQISNDLNLDTEKVMQCYQNSNNEEALEDRNNAVRNIGNFGTPNFFVGNREKGFVEISGAQPLPRFEQAFETVRSDDPGNLTSLEGIEIKGEPSKGSADATIKVLEYNEFGCPFCSEWNGFDASSRTPINQLQIADSLESQYVETGDVQLISKDYPVPQLHPNGPKAHKAANCVYEHEKDSYWKFHDQLFQTRDKWMRG